MASEVGSAVARRTAEDFAGMANKAASRGSYRFVHLTAWDDKKSFPPQRVPHTDNPFKEFRGWQRIRWLVQDIRMFGAWGTLRKWHYLQDVWRKKGEKIFQGRDDVGNTYWKTHDGPKTQGGRWVEPVDPHWFRGGDFHTPTGRWHHWMIGHTAHTPAQMQARGEGGPHGRFKTQHPFTFQSYTGMMTSHGLDPTYIPQAAVLFSPWYKNLREAGFSRWCTNTTMPMYFPMLEPHDVKPELVEDFYRGLPAYQRWSRGQDHDEWKNA